MSNRAISTELIELGERIRKRRQEMKLSQESFAEKAGISVNTVSRIEGGQTAMSVEIFRKMIEILETDANILMGKEGDDAEKRKQKNSPYMLRIIVFCAVKIANREKETETRKGDRIDDQTRKFNL